MGRFIDALTQEKRHAPSIGDCRRMSGSNTQAENIADIKVTLAFMAKELGEARNDIKDMKRDLAEDKADLAALKNKGTGILIGVALGGAAIATGLKAFVLAVVAAFK